MDLTLSEQVRLRMIADKYDENMDGYGIGEEDSLLVLETANWVVGHQDTGLAREYFSLIQQRDLLAQ